MKRFFGGIVIKIERSTETFKRGGVYDMEQAALKKMRTKQIAVSNLFVGLMIIVFFMLIQIVKIQFTHFLFV